MANSHVSSTRSFAQKLRHVVGDQGKVRSYNVIDGTVHVAYGDPETLKGLLTASKIPHEDWPGGVRAHDTQQEQIFQEQEQARRPRNAAFKGGANE